jgi:hypothetical protein
MALIVSAETSARGLERAHNGYRFPLRFGANRTAAQNVVPVFRFGSTEVPELRLNRRMWCPQNVVPVFRFGSTEVPELRLNRNRNTGTSTGGLA